MDTLVVLMAVCVVIECLRALTKGAARVVVMLSDSPGSRSARVCAIVIEALLCLSASL